MANVNLSTENAIVNKVGKMAFTGNVIPEMWYKTIVSPKGKVNLLSVILLAEIVYWYRPAEIRDEMTGDVSWKKKFSDKDYLQKSYGKICEKFNVTARQAREALTVLENLGVVKRHFRTVETNMGKCPNVMFIELNPDVLYNLTFDTKVDGKNDRPSGTNTDDKSSQPEKDKTPSCTEADVCPEKPSSEKRSSSPKEAEACSHQEGLSDSERREGKRVFTKKETYAPLHGKTNTKTSTKTSTETSTTTALARDVVEQATEIFADLKLGKKHIVAIVNAAQNDLDKCRDAMSVYRQQRKPIRNVTGWLIDAVRNGYILTPSMPPAKNGFNDFSGQVYTPEIIDAMEKEILESYGQVT